MMVRQRQRGEGGMTLIELMVSMLILSLVMVMVIKYFRDQQKTIAEQTAVSEVQQNQRAAMDMIMRDLRPAGEDAGMTGQFGVVAADRYTIVVTMDVNANNRLDTNRVAFPESSETRGFRFDRVAGQLFSLEQNRPSGTYRWQLAATNFAPDSGMQIFYFDTVGVQRNPPFTVIQLRALKRLQIELRGRSLRPVGSRRQFVLRSLSSDIVLRNVI